MGTPGLGCGGGRLGHSCPHQRLDAALESTLEAIGLGRTPGDGCGHAVAPTSQLALKLTQQFAGANQVGPAGHDLAPHHRAVAHLGRQLRPGEVERCGRRRQQGVTDPLLVGQRSRHLVGPIRQGTEGAGQGSAHHLGPNRPVGRHLLQP